MTDSLQNYCRELGLQFDDIGLFKCALTHRSASGRNNERLEFLGDAVLGFVIAECLYQKFPDSNEGILSRLRANLVNQQSLADLARELNIGKHLVLGSGELKSGGYDRNSILSDALEAIMGAILKDRGILESKDWILKLFAVRIADLPLQSWDKDPKTRLQELMQSQGLDLPKYTLESKCGLPHSQSFVIECRVSILPESSVGKGSSRKKAEQQAAEKMLDQLPDKFISDS